MSFFFNDTATTEIYTLSLHDALPISRVLGGFHHRDTDGVDRLAAGAEARSEEHTSELQSRLHLVCRLLLEKKKKKPDAAQVESSTQRVESMVSVDYCLYATIHVYRIC